jgi:hypothetical protein
VFAPFPLVILVNLLQVVDYHLHRLARLKSGDADRAHGRQAGLGMTKVAIETQNQASERATAQNGINALVAGGWPFLIMSQVFDSLGSSQLFRSAYEE